jgi:hypothetical protein
MSQWKHHRSQSELKRPLLNFALLDSQRNLLEQIRSLNLRLGRDSNACIRQVATPVVVQPAKELNFEATGFRKVEQMDTKPVLAYLKTIKVQKRKKPQSLSPSQRLSLDRREEEERTKPTLSERLLLQSTLNAQAAAARQQADKLRSSDLQRFNKLHIFPKAANEVRANSLVSVRLQRQNASFQGLILREMDRLIDARAPVPKAEPVILTAEEKERRENERRLRLCGQLEGQIVDTLAKAEHRMLERDDEEPVVRLSSEQITAKLSKMMCESKRREPMLLRTRNLPIVSLREVSRPVSRLLRVDRPS